jgi:hypothetical protein
MNSHKHPSRGIWIWTNKPDDHYMVQASREYLRKRMRVGGCRILYVNSVGVGEGGNGCTGPVYYG